MAIFTIKKFEYKEQKVLFQKDIIRNFTSFEDHFTGKELRFIKYKDFEVDQNTLIK